MVILRILRIITPILVTTLGQRQTVFVMLDTDAMF